MDDTKIYERQLYDKERCNEEVKRYSSLIAQTVYDYWDNKLISMLELSKNDMVLDYGCGIGVLSGKINCKLIVGIDISKSLIRIAKERYKRFFIIADGENLPFKQNVFDKTIGRGVLHHLSNPKAGASEVKRVSKPNSKIIFSEPNNKNIFVLLVRKMLKTFKASYSKEQKSFNQYFLKNLFPNSQIIYFGYISYILAFPDIFQIKFPIKIVKFFILFDEFLSKVPLINILSWHIITKSG